MKTVKMLNRKAYVIVGPESSGNRMMAKAIASTKDFGDGGFTISEENKFIFKELWLDFDKKYDLDALDEALNHSPNDLIFVSSVPTRPQGTRIYPEIAKIVDTIIVHSYRVFPIVMHRDKAFTVMSQIGRGHAHHEEVANINIDSAYDHIFSEFAKVNVFPLIVKYEEFVTNSYYRSYFLRKMLDLPNTAQMEFFNANDKY